MRHPQPRGLQLKSYPDGDETVCRVTPAAVRAAKGRERVVEATLRSAGKERARAEVIAVEVPPGWREA